MPKTRSGIVDVNGKTLSRYVEEKGDVTILATPEPTCYSYGGSLPDVIDIVVTKRPTHAMEVLNLPEKCFGHNPVLLTLEEESENE